MTAPLRPDMAGNAFLSVLLDHDLERIEPHLMKFDMKAGDVLIHAGEDVVNTWLPCQRALVAYCITAEDGQSVDVGYIGWEGAIGGIVSNGNVPAYATAVVRISGPFLRIKTSALEQLKLESISLRHWFSRYADCLLAQVFQTSACNAIHTIRQRIAKLILAGVTRTGETEVLMTQEQMADMLGVGRTYINRTLSQMRKEEIIAARRGVLVIKDMPALRICSCGCQMAVEDHFDIVLHGIYPPA